MKFTCLLTSFLAAASLVCSAVSLPNSLKTEKQGAILWNGVKISHDVIYGKWQSARKEVPEIHRNNGKLTVTQTHIYPDSSGKGSISLTPLTENSFQLESKDEIPAGIKPNLRYLSLTVPVANAGKIIFSTPKGTREFRFPEKYGKMILGHFHQVSKAELFLKDGCRLVFHPGGKTVYLQDDRPFSKRPGQSETFSIRIWHSGDVFSCKMETLPVKNTLLDLTPVATRPVRDDIAEDCRGGWTDQGAQNDLRMFKPGNYSYRTIRFQVKKPNVIAVAGK